MKKISIFGLLAALFLSTSVFADPIKTIRFATEATYPPFEFIDSTGEMKGFDIDIANALCQQMSAQCKFSNQSFNSLIPSLKLGKFDALIAAIGMTEERQKQISFSTPYYIPSACFVAPLAKHYTMTSIIGKKIAVQEGTTFEKYLHDTYRSKVTMKSYASIQDAFLDLIAGRVDIVLTDMPIAQAWLKQNSNDYGMVDGPVVQPQYFGEGYGIAVNKDNKDLLNAINKALSDIKANGTYDKIVKKYF